MDTEKKMGTCVMCGATNVEVNEEGKCAACAAASETEGEGA